MRQSSIVIHKGGREEKYEIYVEDYVVSFLKEETGTLELSEFYFYGFRENSKRYIIYGAGRNKNLTVFDKYKLLDEIGCRLTQAGPVFLVKEPNGIYEIKGYEVFYQDNKEMQSYLIDRKKESAGAAVGGVTSQGDQGAHTDKNKAETLKTIQSKLPHSAISVQLCIILVALVAIVINSTNSYDKMRQLNQSASEVFFAIENQEAQDAAQVKDVQDEIVVERDTAQESMEREDLHPDEPDSSAAVSDLGQEEDVLKLVTLENEEQAEEQQEDDQTNETEESTESVSERDAEESDAEESESETGERQEDSDANTDNQEGVEALSRNVARYYEIERGDTLYTISRKIYGDTVHVQKICELNQITNPDHIRYGQKIILP